MDSDAVLAMLQEVAAEVITPRFRRLAEGEVMEKNPGDLVTVADHEAEEIITRRLREAYPDALILGEEAASAHPRLFDELTSSDHWFTVDPVDGTKNFVHGSPDHAVMVSEVHGREIVRAWIWQPELGHAYVAEHQAGAYLDGERLTLRTPPALDSLRGVTSVRSQVGTSLGDLPPLDLSWVCCGVDYPQLVTGGTDYIVYGRTKPWDHVPGTLLTREVGGYVAHTDGSPYLPADMHGALLVAAGPEAFEKVQALLP
ncbi:inositol monophosphatase family protein [Luteipulveratus halotolerans]|uniref:Inositol monophosphatase n=1 Tax=Luteipulveratus halotolerans TaxID=1631356 RepID=A0A0L6CEL2_9MICO|nr:inositol monophosphatase [Luteipulveratus halotolerans]KNX36252.1 inositol monophosphatase [Luteipulveratus halotolerans]